MSLPGWARPAGAVVAVAAVAAGLGVSFGFRAHLLGGGAGPGATSPSGRTGAAMAYDPATGDVVLFGGADRAGHVRDDTWAWNGSVWRELHPAVSPPAVAGALMAYDQPTGALVLFGGSRRGPLEAVPAIACATSVPAPAPLPPASPKGPEPYDPLPTAPATKLPPDSFPPCPTLPPNPPAETWLWDGSNWQHTTANGPDVQPGSVWMGNDPVSGHATLVADDPAAWQRCDWVPCSNGEMTLQWQGDRWRRLDVATGVADPARAWAAHVVGLVENPTTSRLALLEQKFPLVCGDLTAPGGSGAGVPVKSGALPEPCPLADDVVANTLPAPAGTFSLRDWTGAGWSTPLVLKGGPAFLNPSLIASDPARHELVLSGVADDASPHRSTWVWNGSWSERKASKPPAVTTGPSIAYDEKTSDVVMFGGMAPQEALYGPDPLPVSGTTWTWDGSWHLRAGSEPTPAPSPPSPGVVPPIPPVDGGTPCPTHAAGAHSGQDPICPVLPEPSVTK